MGLFARDSSARGWIDSASGFEAMQFSGLSRTFHPVGKFLHNLPDHIPMHPESPGAPVRRVA